MEVSPTWYAISYPVEKGPLKENKKSATLKCSNVFRIEKESKK